MFRLLVGLACVALLLGVLSIVRPPDSSYFWDRLFDTGHILIFGLITISLLKATDSFLHAAPRLTHYVLSITGSIVIGIVVEVAQEFHGERTAEWIDLYNDVVGAISFGCLYAAFDPQLDGNRTFWLRRTTLTGIAIVLLVAGAIPFLDVCRQYHRRHTLFPVLMEFSDPWYQNFCFAQSSAWRASPHPEGWPLDQRRSALIARVDAVPGPYPGFVVHEPFPDWRGYRSLEIDVYLEDSQPRFFVLRVNDRQHNNDVDDRFNKTVKIRPGFQTLSFDLEAIEHAPNGRDLQLGQVDGVALFMVNLEAPLTFYLGQMRLRR